MVISDQFQSQSNQPTGIIQVHVIKPMRMFQSVCRSLGTVLMNKNEVHDGSWRRINSRNVCHYSVKKFNIPHTFQNDEDQDIQNNFAFFLCVKSGFLLSGKNINYKFWKLE